MKEPHAKSKTLPWLLYGANGYTGQLLIEEALRRGHRPLLAGRSEAKLKPLAERYGLELRIATLDDAATLGSILDGVGVVLHAAGPFSRTSEPMVQACLAQRAHYLDITGEVSVFANTFGHDREAQERGVALISGVGFDVVPSDCLAAYVAKQLPDACELELAITGLGHVSAGTAKSMFEGGLDGATVRRDGQLVSQPFGKGARSVRFDCGVRSVLPIPWGDLETAYRSTGIPNITTYMAYPPRLVSLARASAPISGALLPLLRGTLGRGPLKTAIERSLARIEGPSEDERAGGSGHVWARAAAADGREVQAWLKTVDGYTLTALAGVRIVERMLSSNLMGALTPAQAFGADFVLELEGTRRFDTLPETKSTS